MNFTNIKLTQNQQLLVNAVLSMFGSALVAAAQAVYQYVTQHGLINLQQVLLVFIGAFWVTLSTALVAYIPAHIQQELDDLRTFQQQVTAQPIASTPSAPAQPLVVIHTTTMPTVQSSDTVAPTPSVVQQRATPQHMNLTNPTGGSTVAVPMSTVQPLTRNGDLLGDLPASPASYPNRITGVVPTYGASSK